MRGISEALVRAVKSEHIYMKFEVNIGVHKGSVLSPLMCTIVIDIVTNETKDDMLQEIMYVARLVLITETMAELRKKSYIWKKEP